MSDDWIEWRGGECPVDAGSIVDVRFRDGTEWPEKRASDLCREGENFWVWEPTSSEDDIVAYRVAQPKVERIPVRHIPIRSLDSFGKDEG